MMVMVYKNSEMGLSAILGTSASKYSRTPFICTLVIRIANYPDRLDPPVKLVEKSTKLSCLEITVIGSGKVHFYG
jgi:hypothetical protein